MRDDREKLQDIKGAIGEIEKYASRDYADFAANELYQVWMLHFLRIIGEACRSLSDAIREQYPEVPWKEIVGPVGPPILRHRLGYGLGYC